jgi:hypothetical protein
MGVAKRRVVRGQLRVGHTFGGEGPGSVTARLRGGARDQVGQVLLAIEVVDLERWCERDV